MPLDRSTGSWDRSQESWDRSQAWDRSSLGSIVVASRSVPQLTFAYCFGHISQYKIGLRQGQGRWKEDFRRTKAILCERSDSDVLGVKNVCEVPELSGSGNISKYLNNPEKLSKLRLASDGGRRILLLEDS
jgi:hypothetical protein